jgi:hypothetical protein
MNAAPSTTPPAPALDNECINTLRFFSVDAVQKTDSGHPGMPMGAASMSYVLWTRFLKHNPANPEWFDRDRFVPSPGHGSMLLYSLLHLTGYDLPLEQIKQFRKWGSVTPGHPRARRHARRRDNHRAARSRLRQRSAFGDGRSVPRRLLQPSRLRDRQPFHIRDRQRRRPDGGPQHQVSHIRLSKQVLEQIEGCCIEPLQIIQEEGEVRTSTHSSIEHS